MGEGFEQVAVQIAGNSREDLEALSAMLRDQGSRTAPVESVGSSSDLHFDPGAAAAVTFQIITVITKVGAAAQLAAWVHQRLEERRGGKLVISIDADRIEIPPDADPERTRKLLLAALHAM